MTKSALKAPIGIYGGTFDPIHFGHLRPNLELYEILQLKEVRFIPSYIPPHREQPESSARQRLKMVAAAIEAEPAFLLDNREIVRQGSSYMVDTLASLRKEFISHPLCLLMGMDAFLHIQSWYQWQHLLDYAHIVVSERPKTDFNAVRQWPGSLQTFYQKNQGSKADVHARLNGKIILQAVTQLDISATDIRHRIKNGQSVRYLLPEPVINLINYYQLYAGNQA